MTQMHVAMKVFKEDYSWGRHRYIAYALIKQANESTLHPSHPKVAC